METKVYHDPVVIHDVMREAANRLRGLYSEQVTVGGLSDPAIIAMREITAEVDSVSLTDMDAQKEKTAQLHERYVEVINGITDGT